MAEIFLRKIYVKVWRQRNAAARGRFETYTVENISTGLSFLEMLDVLNNKLIEENTDPIAFDHDCREGICGACSLYINGRPHGPGNEMTTCQLHMRRFKDGETIIVEPWRAGAFPVIKDLIVDRKAFDKILQAGGFISVNTGGVPDANTIPVSPEDAEHAMDVASCIGCGACVAACKNSSAMLFVAAKVSHLYKLPQGKLEAKKRVRSMMAKMDELGFGSCSNTGACEAECPQNISIANIARLNRQFLKSQFSE